MKHLLYLVLWLLIVTTSQAQNKSQYTFTIDLVEVKDDKVAVTLVPPAIATEEVVYNIPRMVPGTYSVDNFGRYISGFQALDKTGKALPVQKLDENRWQIGQARTLAKITYWVDDTFEEPKDKPQVFEPTGTNIEAGKNYLINTHGFMGYFDNMKRVPYEVTFLKPPHFYGATALDAARRSPESETYVVPTYMEMVDSPLMFTQPDTTELKVGGTRILISVYSPNKLASAAGIAPMIGELLEAQRNYLGGTLPVNKYAFLLYLTDKANNTGATGALEHSYSSVYYMRERDNDAIADQLRDFAAHEFFHIVTPLNIHAEQIHNFDFNNPEMSKHQWLYEGTTEYAASHVQVNQKLISPEEYLTVLRNYILGAGRYNDSLPFTVMSQGALDKHASQYGNVYQKGALIGLALDIRLRELSGGQYGLRNLMAALSKTYGKNQGFRDEELFDKITALTYPEIREFFRRYVEGPETLPYAEIFKAVGVTYQPVIKEKAQTLGGINLGYDREAGKLFVARTDQMNAFGKKLGFQPGDLLLAINDQALTPQNMQGILKKEVTEGKEGRRLRVLVGRKDGQGSVKEVTLKGKLLRTLEEKRHILRFDDQATPQQKILRDAWLYGTL
jgi:predicted metalloprotease with PDZ domain